MARWWLVEQQQIFTMVTDLLTYWLTDLLLGTPTVSIMHWLQNHWEMLVLADCKDSQPTTALMWLWIRVRSEPAENILWFLLGKYFLISPSRTHSCLLKMSIHTSENKIFYNSVQLSLYSNAYKSYKSSSQDFYFCIDVQTCCDGDQRVTELICPHLLTIVS